MKKIILFPVFLLLLISCNDIKKADQLRLENKFEEAFELYKKTADKGDAYAQWRVSNAYRSGDGVDVDTVKYKEYIDKAVKGGCEEAIFDQSKMIYTGRFGYKKDEEKAKKTILDLVEKTKNSYVLSQYARLLLYGDGMFEQDKDKALSVLNRIEDKDDPVYNLAMGEVYCAGAGDIEINYKKALEYFEKAYKNGSTYSAELIGNIYMKDNDEMSKDIEKSIEWYKKASDRNSTQSMLNLAQIYLDEDTTFQKFHNPQKGLECVKKAMRHMDGDAYAMMGSLYQEGKTVEKNDEKALESYKKATELKSAWGAFQLGLSYMEGMGCDKNYQEGVKAWEKAVEFGNGSAANNLFCYYYGIAYDMKKKDKEKAKKYLIKGAELGDDFAQKNLAWFYFNGSDIIKKNVNQGFIYAKLAADQGQPDACEMVANCYDRGIGTNRDPQKAEEYRKKINPDKK